MLLSTLAECSERVRATSSKLEKVELAAGLLRESPPEILQVVCRMLVGRIFPSYSDEDLEVGWATLWGCIQALSGATQEELAEAYDRTGDLGSACELIFSKKPRSALFRTHLSVAETHRELVELAGIRGKGSLERKKRILCGLLNMASPKEAKFIVKTITGDMRSGFKEGLLEDAVVKAFSADPEKVRRAHMVSGDLGEAAEAASRGLLDQLSIKVGRPVRHMLAQSIDELEDGLERYGEALVEFKYDGSRVGIHKEGKDVKVFTRKSEEVSRSLPEVVDAIRKVDGDFILDGEIVPYEGRPKAFQYLIRRLRRKYGVERLAKEVPVKLYVFDLLYLNGESLIDFPLVRRRRLLENLVKPEEHVAVSDALATSNPVQARGMFEEALSRGFEGLMIKNPQSKYTPGRRGLEWLKFKGEAQTLDLVVIAVEYGHGKRAGWLSDYTFAAMDNEGNLVPVAKAYCGLTDEEIKRMTEYFKRTATGRVGRRYSVEPKVVVEVKFGEVQRSPSYPSGFALRFPRIRRIRWDKPVGEVDTIQKIEQLYEKQRRRF